MSDSLALPAATVYEAGGAIDETAVAKRRRLRQRGGRDPRRPCRARRPAPPVGYRDSLPLLAALLTAAALAGAQVGVSLGPPG